MARRYNNIIVLIEYITKNELHLLKSERTIEESEIDYTLIKEYFRRAVQIPGFKGNSIGSFLFLDAVRTIGGEPSISIDEPIKKLYPDVSNIKYTVLKKLCENCINLLIFAEQGNIQANKYCDVYEPILLFFAIGGTIRAEHGWLDIGKVANPLGAIISQALNSHPIDIYKIASPIWKLSTN